MSIRTFDPDGVRVPVDSRIGDFWTDARLAIWSGALASRTRAGGRYDVSLVSTCLARVTARPNLYALNGRPC